MSRTITRTLPTTIVTGVVMVDGKGAHEVITRTYEGVKLTKNQALNELKKEFKEGCMVSNIMHEEHKYEISVGVFIANAQKVIE
jgi:hypothetical protein